MEHLYALHFREVKYLKPTSANSQCARDSSSTFLKDRKKGGRLGDISMSAWVQIPPPWLTQKRSTTSNELGQKREGLRGISPRWSRYNVIVTFSPLIVSIFPCGGYVRLLSRACMHHALVQAGLRNLANHSSLKECYWFSWFGYNLFSIFSFSTFFWFCLNPLINV